MCKIKELQIPKNSAYLITERTWRKYFLGADIEEGTVVLADNKITLFTDARYFAPAREKANSLGADCVLYNGYKTLGEFFKKLGVKKIFIDYQVTTLAEYEEYLKFGVKIVDANLSLCKIRSVKTREERGKIKTACDITFRAVQSAIKTVKAGITEIELKDEIEKKMIEFGADGFAFSTIVAFGKNSAVPHHQTGEDKLQEDSVILIDTGCTYQGYCSDLTRTFFFGTPSRKFLDCYQAVLDANILAEEKITCGTPAKSADKIARNYLKEKRLAKYFTHSLGHGLGLEIHEYPRVSKKSKAVLEENTVFTVEPGVYFDEEFGIRIEDTVCISNGRVERYFTDDKNLVILKK